VQCKFVVLCCSPQNPRNDDKDSVLKSRCNSASCLYCPTTLRPLRNFRSAPETPSVSSAVSEKKRAESTKCSSADRGPVVSPVRVFSGRGVARSGLVPHSSFNSYFRPALVVRRGRPLSPPPLSPRTPKQSPDHLSPSADQQLTHTGSISSSPHRLYRKQVVRKTSSARRTPSIKSALRSSPSIGGGGGGGGGLAMRRRSVYGHVGSGAGGVLPANIRRRNTVVGGDPVEHQSPPPVPLSLREIYRLSRHGSLFNRRTVHAGRRSTFSALRSEKDGAWTSSKAGGVAVTGCESGRSRRLASFTSQRASVGSGVPGDNDATVDVRRRRSGADSILQNQRLTRSHSSDTEPLQQSQHSHDNQDASKTHTFNIILVESLAFTFIILYTGL